MSSLKFTWPPMTAPQGFLNSTLTGVTCNCFNRYSCRQAIRKRKHHFPLFFPLLTTCSGFIFFFSKVTRKVLEELVQHRLGRSRHLSKHLCHLIRLVQSVVLILSNFSTVFSVVDELLWILVTSRLTRLNLSYGKMVRLPIITKMS